MAATGTVARAGFIGLGAMGKSMAGHVSKRVPTVVYDIFPEAVAGVTSANPGCISGTLADIAGCDAIFSSLPRSSDVEVVAQELMASGALKPGTKWVDTTSGVPEITRWEEEGRRARTWKAREGAGRGTFFAVAAGQVAE